MTAALKVTAADLDRAAIREQRRLNELQLLKDVQSYIADGKNHHYQFGGVFNLLVLVSQAIENVADEAGWHGLDPAALKDAQKELEILCRSLERSHGSRL